MFFLLMPLSITVLSADSLRDSPGPAAYWQINYNVPRYGYVHSISLITPDLHTTEKKIAELADRLGVSALVPHRRSNPVSIRPIKILTFTATQPAAMVFCDKLKDLTAINRYSINSHLNPESHEDAARKAGLISAELDRNKTLFAELPMTRSLMTDLLGGYREFLAAYEKIRNTAIITVRVTAE